MRLIQEKAAVRPGQGCAGVGRGGAEGCIHTPVRPGVRVLRPRLLGWAGGAARVLSALGLLCGFAWDGFSQPEGLRLERRDGLARLDLRGQASEAYALEGRERLGTGAWESLLTVGSSASPMQWFDPDSAGAPARFYRWRRLEAPIEPQTVENFRLLDATGSSHELYYHTDARVIVLLMAGTDLSSLASASSFLRGLTTSFASPAARFWVVLSDPAASRVAVLSKAREIGLDIPVLLDGDQLVARGLGVVKAPEWIVVGVPDFSIRYRGRAGETLSTGAGQVTQRYVGDAVAAVAQGAVASVVQTVVRGASVAFERFERADYAAEIAPLLQAKCVVCHSPGNIGPWAMTDHDAVVAHRRSMVREVMSGTMPPWDADPEYGSFAGDRSLSRDEKRKLLQWLEDGAPRGNGPDPLTTPAPPPPRWPVELGEPDAVITIPPQSIMESGAEPYRYVYAQSPIPTNAWLRAAIVRPSNPRVVHHYLVWPGQSAAQRTTGLALYVPGRQPQGFPEGTGVFLPARTWLTFNLHYTPDGEAATDQPELGLYFLPQAPLKELKTTAILTPFFFIPPGASEQEVTAEYTFQNAVTVRDFFPHMHLRGARMRFEATYPDGRAETLLSVPRYRFHWQSTYRLAQPRALPAGTRLRVTGAFDNSPRNLENPDPSAYVFWGDQSWDEMFIGYVDYTEGN